MRIGLTPGWYLSGYCFMLNQFVEVVAKRFENDAKGLSQVVQALNKMVFLDMHFVIDAYLGSKNESVRGILLRATRFAEDVEGLNQKLASDVQDVQIRTKALAIRDETLKEQATRILDMVSQASTTDAEFAKSITENKSMQLVNSRLGIAVDFITGLVDEVNAGGGSTQQVLAASGQLSSQIKKWMSD